MSSSSSIKSTSTNSSSISLWITVGLTAVTAFVSGTVVGYQLLNRQQRSKKKTTTTTSAEAEAETKLWKMVDYTLCSTMIRVADKLDLFEYLYEKGPITSQNLAFVTEYNERWLREILLQLTAQKICDYNPQTQQFSLRSEYATFLRSPFKEKKSIIGTFQFLSALIPRGDATVEACKTTGQGIDYDVGDECIGEALDRKNGNYFRYILVDDVLSISLEDLKSFKIFD